MWSKRILQLMIVAGLFAMSGAYSYATVENFTNRYGEEVEEQMWPGQPTGRNYTVFQTGGRAKWKIRYEDFRPGNQDRYPYRKVKVYHADGETVSHEQIWDLQANGDYKLNQVMEHDSKGQLCRRWILDAGGTTPKLVHEYNAKGLIVCEEELRPDGSVSKRTTFRRSAGVDGPFPAIEVFKGKNGGVRQLPKEMAKYPGQKDSLEPK